MFQVRSLSYLEGQGWEDGDSVFPQGWAEDSGSSLLLTLYCQPLGSMFLSGHRGVEKCHLATCFSSMGEWNLSHVNSPWYTAWRVIFYYHFQLIFIYLIDTHQPRPLMVLGSDLYHLFYASIKGDQVQEIFKGSNKNTRVFPDYLIVQVPVLSPEDILLWKQSFNQK